MTTFNIPNMSCGHCKATVQKTIHAIDPAPNERSREKPDKGRAQQLQTLDLDGAKTCTAAKPDFDQSPK